MLFTAFCEQYIVKCKWIWAFLGTKASEEENIKEIVFRMNRFFNRKSIAFTLVALALLVGVLGTLGIRNASHAAGMSYTFKTLDDHADPTFNQLLGINDHGKIAGYFGSGCVT